MTASIAPNTQLIGLANRTPYKIDRFIAKDNCPIADLY